MKIGIVSDTRDNREGLKLLLDRFLVAGARWLFHCGGLGSVEMVDLLKPWQVYMVRGERERDWQAIEVALQKSRLQSSLPTQLTATLDGRRIGLCRGEDMKLVNQWAKSGQFDYIFHGHTLRRRDEQQGRTRIINPGALSGLRYQPRSGCLIDLATGEVKFIEIPG
ncbi:MAG TPA: metallophosphoesterase family protein [Anaerolineae bacterium]|nr:metallophosphoesterase family protein [Anaerolineae bacterium]